MVVFSESESHDSERWTAIQSTNEDELQVMARAQARVPLPACPQLSPPAFLLPGPLSLFHT